MTIKAFGNLVPQYFFLSCLSYSDSHGNWVHVLTHPALCPWAPLAPRCSSVTPSRPSTDAAPPSTSRLPSSQNNFTPHGPIQHITASLKHSWKVFQLSLTTDRFHHQDLSYLSRTIPSYAVQNTTGAPDSWIYCWIGETLQKGIDFPMKHETSLCLEVILNIYC